MPMPKRYYIELGYACNNKCLWCFNPSDKGASSFEQIKEYLDRNIAADCSVAVSGGEPTIHPDFIRIMDYIAKSGAVQTSLFTNGRKFSDMEFAVETIKHSGELIFIIALHGHTPEIHDRLTQSPGSFDEAVAGINNIFRLQARGFPVNIYLKFLIPRENIKHLPQAVRWLSDGFPRPNYLIIQSLELVNRASEHRQELLITLTDAVPYLTEAIQVGVSCGQRIGLLNIPPCIFPEPASYYSFTLPINLQDVNVYKPMLCRETLNEASRFSKAPQCKECEADSFCDGVWTPYAKSVGLNELRPIKTLKQPVWLRADSKII